MRVLPVALLVLVGCKPEDGDEDGRDRSRADWLLEDVDDLSQARRGEQIDTDSLNVGIALLGDVLGLAYYKTPEGETRAAFEGASGWDKVTVDPVGGAGAALVLGPDDNVRVTYTTNFEATPAYAIRVATETGTGFSIENLGDVLPADNYYRCPTTPRFDGADLNVVACKGEGPMKPAIATYTSAWALEVVPTPSTHSTVVAAAWDSAGNPHLMYSAGRYDAGANEWYSKPTYAWFDGTWHFEDLQPEAPEISGFGFNAFSIAIDGTGTVHTVYGREDSPSSSEWSQSWWYGVRTTGGVWNSEDLQVSGATLFVDGSGVAHVAATVGTDVQYRRKTSSGWFVQRVRTGIGIDVANRNLGIVLDASGAPAIAYIDSQALRLSVSRPAALTGTAPAAWECPGAYYADGYCDCGCGDSDEDCAGAGCPDGGCVADACDYCWGGDATNTDGSCD